MFHEDDGQTAIASLVLGGIVGASLALILMPRSEAETRRAPALRAGRMSRHGRGLFDDLSSRGRHGLGGDAASREARERVPEPGLSSTSPTLQGHV